MMDRIERVAAMERNYDEAFRAAAFLSEALERYRAALGGLKSLADYYESEQWQKDYDDDRAGFFPKDMKRGVLSQDAVYDLLMENERIKTLMEELI